MEEWNEEVEKKRRMSSELNTKTSEKKHHWPHALDVVIEIWEDVFLMRHHLQHSGGFFTR